MEERHAGGRCTPYFLAELRARLVALGPQQLGDSAITVNGRLAGELDDRRAQHGFIVSHQARLALVERGRPIAGTPAIVAASKGRPISPHGFCQRKTMRKPR